MIYISEACYMHPKRRFIIPSLSVKLKLMGGRYGRQYEKKKKNREFLFLYDLSAFDIASLIFV